MSKRKLKNNNHRQILGLKSILEDKRIAEEELAIGVIELTEILGDFREKVLRKQRQQFDKDFFGIEKNKNDVPASQHCTVVSTVQNNVKEKTSLNRTPELSSISKIQLPAWSKKLYKQIMQRSHPDRYIDFPVKEIKQKFTKVYIEAVAAYEKGDLATILVCAFDVEISIAHIPEATEIIQQATLAAKNKISMMGNLIAYQWYHLEENKRIEFLRKYLTDAGYEFELKKAETSIRKRVKRRKPGTRPEKMRVKNN